MQRTPPSTSHANPWRSARNGSPRLRGDVGPEPVLGIDYHHRLSVAEAASFCQRMPSGTLDWLEEPIRDEIPEAYEALRRLTDVPFAIGEEISSKWHFLPPTSNGASPTMPASTSATWAA